MAWSAPGEPRPVEPGSLDDGSASTTYQMARVTQRGGGQVERLAVDHARR